MPYISCEEAHCDQLAMTGHCSSDHWVADPAPVDQLRALVRWVDQQDENHWNPPGGKAPTIPQIFVLHSLCVSWGVSTPTGLATHPNPNARRAWETWKAQRG